MSPERTNNVFVPHDKPRPVRSSRPGFLSGLTAAVKDMYDVAGEVTGGGNPQWLASHQPASRNAVAVERILSSGADIIGRTVCDEFFYSITGINAHYGTPVNVHAPGRIPGGSSSGSAAATAAGACDFALGSDTGGSVRVPAALCGVYGIRATHGRVDLTGAMAMAPSFDSAGWFSAGPGVFRKVGSILLDDSFNAEHPTKLLISRLSFQATDEAIAVKMRKFLTCAAEVLPPIKVADIGPEAGEDWVGCFRTIQAYEVWQTYGTWISEHSPALGPGIRERIAYAATVSNKEAALARSNHMKFRTRIREILTPGTLLCLPTVPCIAPLVSSSSEDLENFRSRTMAFTCIAGLAGLPQVSIPATYVNRCPAGLSFVGWPGSDEILLDLAVALSRYCGNHYAEADRRI